MSSSLLWTDQWAKMIKNVLLNYLLSKANTSQSCTDCSMKKTWDSQFRIKCLLKKYTRMFFLLWAHR